MTFTELKQIIASLKAENNPKMNDKIIAFYENLYSKEMSKAINKGLKIAFQKG